jgi:hypothetical protein
MITLRNTDMALAFTALAGEAGLTPGMIVKFVQGTSSGDAPKVVKAAAADLDDAKIKKGIVHFAFEDSQEVDFDINVGTSTLTAQAKTIPAGGQVTVFTGRPVIAYHKSALDSSITFGSLREGAQIGFDGTTGLPGLFAAGEAGGRENYMGWVYRMDGAEVTIAFENL